jgi:hypothetical protein
MKKDYDRSISLICPTCAGSEFEFDSSIDELERVYTCAGCGLTCSHRDILASNSARISAEIEEMKNEVISDMRKDFRKIFSGMKGWKLK